MRTPAILAVIRGFGPAAGWEGDVVMRGNIAPGAGAGQLHCDERGIRADERRDPSRSAALRMTSSHLPEEMDVAAAHRQHIVASLQVNLRRFIVMTLHVADRTQIHNNRSMDLRELL